MVEDAEPASEVEEPPPVVVVEPEEEQPVEVVEEVPSASSEEIAPPVRLPSDDEPLPLLVGGRDAAVAMSDNRLLYDRNVVPASPPPRSLSERCTDGVGELLSPSSMPQSAFASSPFGRAA